MERLYVSKKAQEAYLNGGTYLHEQVLQAGRIFQWQCLDDKVETATSIYHATYIIITWEEYKALLENGEDLSRSIDRRWYIVFASSDEVQEAFEQLDPTDIYKWSYKGSGSVYNVTSAGDRRYSPFFMRLAYVDGLNNEKWVTLEWYYQLVLKGYITQGMHSIKECKGLPPLGNSEDFESRVYMTYKDYLISNPGLFYELALIGKSATFDNFFDQDGGQASLYSLVLNDYYFPGWRELV